MTYFLFIILFSTRIDLIDFIGPPILIFLYSLSTALSIPKSAFYSSTIKLKLISPIKRTTNHNSVS